ncbi:MAG: STAS domain-containing protein [Desulfarculus sp.]|nr:STAS domain-containing protein [Desulfarculus sp.]
MIARIFPFMAWFKKYNLAVLRTDGIAGLTVALVLVPQSMAYAQLAGLPAHYGLYAAFLPPMLVSLMTSAALAPLATAGSTEYVAYALLLALLVGVFQFALGVLRLGLVVNFLSHPVVNGFTNAAAIIIATSQLSKMFGVNVDEAPHHYETIMRVVEAALVYTHWPTFIMGALAFGIMFALKRINPKIPYVLVAVAVTTVASWALGFEHNHKAPLEAIKSAELRDLVTSFNQATARAAQHAATRVEVAKQEETAAKEHGERSLEALKAQHEGTYLAMQIEEDQKEARLARRALRALLLEGVPQANGSLSFHLQGQVPPGSQGDGRAWRLSIGNRPLKLEALTFSGGGAVVGTVPAGLPPFSLPTIEMSALGKLFPYAAIISLLGFMEAISIAKAMAAKTGQRLDPNQELIGQGLANILGALGRSYPVSGSFSRSAVNLQAGALTGMSSVFTSLTVLVVLLFFTPLLYHLPQSVLAAVIMMAVVGLVNVSGFVHAWKAQWYDGAISIISFIFTLIFAPHLDKGIMIGVVLSLGVFLYKSMRPKVAALAMHDDCSFRDAQHFGLRQCEHIAVVRFDGPLFFANSSFLEDKITERIMTMPGLRHILIVANGINDMDASGEEALSLIVDRVRSAGFDISFSGVKENVQETMRRTHLWEKIGDDHIFPLLATAVAAIHAEAHRNSSEVNCPLVTVCPIGAYRESEVK